MRNTQNIIALRRKKIYSQLICILFISFFQFDSLDAQIINTEQSGFTWISTETIADDSYGAGYTMYSSAFPIFDKYPGAQEFQMGLGSCWMTTQRTGQEPEQFYTTIEGGLGWWHDTRFATRVPKFIMGGVSLNFHSWANGPGAGRSQILPNGERDWSTPGGKYGIAQLSNHLLWAPDGLNLAQSLNGELLGYGYNPLPLSDEIDDTYGLGYKTGNQYWTLFFNSTNFKGPATCFLPTFWTDPLKENPDNEGFFLDTRPADPNVGFGVEHAGSPALIYTDSDDKRYAKVQPFQFPAKSENNATILNSISTYSKTGLWDRMQDWFAGGTVVSSIEIQNNNRQIPFVQNGGSMVRRIGTGESEYPIEVDYMDNVQLNDDIMGYEFNLDKIKRSDEYFHLPEYYALGGDDRWHAIESDAVPLSSGLLEAEVRNNERPNGTYLTPLDPQCQWQDKDGPWSSPGPTSGPYTVDLGDGSTVTYYWYKFIDQPAVIQANLPDNIRDQLQERVEMIHTHWNHKSDYMKAPEVGQLTTLDPASIVQPPAGFEVGYVPIVTRQEKTEKKLRVFVLAGQSNMVGFGTVDDQENDPNSLVDVVANDDEREWSEIGSPESWTQLEDAHIYFNNSGNILKDNITVGQGVNGNHIGPELMFAHELDKYYNDPILIIKTAYGGKSLGVDFRPPSAGNISGAYYDEMITTVKNVTNNLSSEFPEIDVETYELSGFVWFQGWNDGESATLWDEYESNLSHLIQDVRSDLGNQKLPFVIASSGHGGYELSNDQWVQGMQTKISASQESVGCNDSLYGGHLGFVDTKPFYINESDSPADAIHHFHNNALTFLNIGKSIGNEMKLAINDMAFCYQDCTNPVTPDLVTIGNRVWNDLNQNGIIDPEEPGISGVSLVIWSDSDDDGIPDWQGFGGVEKTDENGYYRFGGLTPGNYVVFVWSVDNWEEGQPLAGFVSTNGFVPAADNNIDGDNNGFGEPFSDIMSGIISLSVGEEPLGDGDPFDCQFDLDGNGNNTIDFGFFDPNVSSLTESAKLDVGFELYPNPASNTINVVVDNDILNDNYIIQIYSLDGRLVKSKALQNNERHQISINDLAKGVYKVILYGNTNTYTKKLVVID